jgi:ferrous iron transport protein A
MRQMKKNQYGTIEKVLAKGELGKRVREMGLVPGTRFRIRERAPLQDPVAVQLQGFTLTLRNNEADHILVTVEEEQA